MSFVGVVRDEAVTYLGLTGTGLGSRVFSHSMVSGNSNTVLDTLQAWTSSFDCENILLLKQAQIKNGSLNDRQIESLDMSYNACGDLYYVQSLFDKMKGLALLSVLNRVFELYALSAEQQINRSNWSEPAKIAAKVFAIVEQISRLASLDQRTALIIFSEETDHTGLKRR